MDIYTATEEVYKKGYEAGKRDATKQPKKKPAIDPANDDFGACLNCAVRYAISRQTYMPHLVIGFITPLLPHLNNKTLWCFDQDVTNAKYEGIGYGDPEIDEPNWMKFLAAVKEERAKRGEEPYKSHWEDWNGK